MTDYLSEGEVSKVRAKVKELRQKLDAYKTEKTEAKHVALMVVATELTCLLENITGA